MSYRNKRSARILGGRNSQLGASGGTFHRVIEELEDRTLLAAAPFLPSQKFLVDYDGFLTGPSTAAPVVIADNFLRSRAADLGILASDLNNALITTNYVTQTTGATTLTFQQTYNGLPVFNAYYNVTVAANGSVLAAGGGFVPGLSQRPGSVNPTLLANQAIVSGALRLGYVTPQNSVIVGQSGLHKFIAQAPGFSLDEIQGGLHYVPVEGNDVKLSWEMTVRTPDGQHWYNASVDASTGDIVALVDFANPASYEVFPFPNENPDEGPRTIQVDPHLINPTPAPVPSPFGWHDTDGVPGPEQTITSGNNVNAYADRDGDDAPDAGSQPDGGAALDFTGALVPIDLTQEPSTYTAASVVNLFYWSNILHDIHYLYGFDEAARNFQVNNYGRGGVGGDALNAQAQDGGQQNNAFMFTPPDGQQPRMMMHEWTLTNPIRTSDLDAEVVVHEYGHGVSNRLTGNAFGLFALQSGGMGEGWSDFWALMLTQTSAAETTAGRGVGTYILGQPASGQGIRDFRYDFDIGDVAQETFLDYGTGPGQSVQSHAAGTRWAAALWDINHLLIDRYGFESNLYNSDSDAGNIKTLHLVMNALKIQPLNPSFIAARDAILAADMMLYDGANQLEIWTAFARRGLGESASTANSDSTVLVTSFDIPESVQVQFSVGPDVALLEGDAGTTLFVFTISSNRELISTATVTFETVDVTATAGSDYIAAAGTLTFAADQIASATVTIAVQGDLTVEDNETFLLRLTNVSQGTIADGEAVGTILNDDVEISVGDTVVVEGHAGTRQATFAVTAFGAVNQTIVVTYSTINGTASAPADFQALAGSITLTPQSPGGQISVPVFGDVLDEFDEQFFLYVTRVEGARVGDGVGAATILDDDLMPNFYVNDAFITTTSAGVLSAVFTVGIDAPSGREVGVSYSTHNGSALDGLDYVGQSGSLVFPAGMTTQQVVVPVLTGADYTANKKFYLGLSNNVHGSMYDPEGAATIIYAPQVQGERILDNGEAGFTQSGTWTNLTNTLAYQLDYDYASPGTQSTASTWNFTALANGSYEVFARWIPFSNRATNAPFTILDGNTPLGTVLVNQQLMPAGDHSNGIVWQSLGTFTITNNTLRVRLTNSANGLVIADAIRIVADGIPAPVPEIDVASQNVSIDMGDMTPAIEDGTDFGNVPSLGVVVSRTFTITNSGNAPLHLTHNPIVMMGGPHASDFTIVTQPAAVVMPGGKTTFQVDFRATGTGVRTGVILIPNDDADESAYTFFLRGTLSNPGAAPLAHNASLPQDVNGDSRVTPSDLLAVINALNGGPAAQPLAATDEASFAYPRYAVDVTGDGYVTPRDMLMVINYLLAPPAVPAAEPAAAEPLAAPAVDEALVLFETDEDESSLTAAFVDGNMAQGSAAAVLSRSADAGLMATNRLQLDLAVDDADEDELDLLAAVL